MLRLTYLTSRRGYGFMIKKDNHIGTISITNSYLTSLIGHAAAGCFGVVRMNPVGARQGVRSNIMGSATADNGVKISWVKGSNHMIIDLHIFVTYGINVSAIVDSIINKVRYVVESETGITVSKINVFVDGMES